MEKSPYRTQQAVFRGLLPRGRFLAATLALGTFDLYNNAIMRQRFGRVKHKTPHK